MVGKHTTFHLRTDKVKELKLYRVRSELDGTVDFAGGHFWKRAIHWFGLVLKNRGRRLGKIVPFFTALACFLNCVPYYERGLELPVEASWKGEHKYG